MGLEVLLTIPLSEIRTNRSLSTPSFLSTISVSKVKIIATAFARFPGSYSIFASSFLLTMSMQPTTVRIIAAS